MHSAQSPDKCDLCKAGIGTHAHTQVADGKLQGKSNAFRTLSAVVRKAMKDKLANVFLNSLATFQTVVDGFSSEVGNKEIQVRFLKLFSCLSSSTLSFCGEPGRLPVCILGACLQAVPAQQLLWLHCFLMRAKASGFA